LCRAGRISHPVNPSEAWRKGGVGWLAAKMKRMAQLLAMSEFLHSTVLIQTEEGKVATGLVFQHEDRVLLLTAAHAVPDASAVRRHRP
jgi:hypothetical protein